MSYSTDAEKATKIAVEALESGDFARARAAAAVASANTSIVIADELHRLTCTLEEVRNAMPAT